MSIDLVWKLAAIGIIVALLDKILKNAGRDEMATVTSLAGLTIALILVVKKIGELFTAIKSTFGL